jgi:predicted ATPase
MIRAVRFKNFKVLRDTTLSLGKFTLLIGPNGSGKSTAISAFRNAANLTPQVASTLIASASAQAGEDASIVVEWGPPRDGASLTARWTPTGPVGPTFTAPEGTPGPLPAILVDELRRVQVYSFDALQLSYPVQPQPNMILGETGSGLAGVLDRLRDQNPERFDALNAELARWLPEFDKVLFDTPSTGQKEIFLRDRVSQHRIPARDLSQGTLLALGILTVAYLPDPPPIAGFEEPDRGIHPRLLRDVRDALYRLAYPEDFGETRSPVQVIATTHSPYMLDLFRDHLDEVVIAEKKGNEARFEPLAQRPDIEKVLHEAQLSDAWYTGVLGGVPTEG